MISDQTLPQVPLELDSSLDSDLLYRLEDLWVLYLAMLSSV